jgi:tetratricopeptide (TPR) repeat protein
MPMHRPLRATLDELKSVVRVGAPTAAVFCAARSLELVAVGAVEKLVSDQPNGSYAALCRLADLGLLTSACKRCFHGLRRLGNDARHRVYEPLSMQDARLATALVVPALRWGGELGVLDEGELGGGVDDALDDVELRDLVIELSYPSGDEDPLSAWGPHRTELLQRYEGLGALHAEHLLTKGRYAQAQQVLEDLGGRRSKDLRLRQLFAWARREQGHLDEALGLLEALYEADKDHRDPETSGLYAGTLKRAWLDEERWKGVAERRRKELLRRTHEAYDIAWMRSKQRNCYNGINAASTAVMLGLPGRGEQIAGSILELYASRDKLPDRVRQASFHDYWDHATYAEALLVAGDEVAARREYKAAFVRFPNQKDGAHRSTCLQLGLLLDHLGLSPNVTEFLS